MKLRIALMVLSAVLFLSLQTGCDSSGDSQGTANPTSTDGADSGAEPSHAHGDGDALHWPKRDVEHAGYMISLGHHGDHWHGGEQIEPAVAIVKDGKDIGEATMTCQLMVGERGVDSPVEMVFELKTEEEPAHFAGAKLTFPAKEKTYLVKFEIKIDGTEETFSDTIEVVCGH